MYSVWFDDLEKAISALREKYPSMATFCSIHGNCNGDFVVKDSVNTFIVRHEDFSVWIFKGKDWRTGQWVEVK